MSDNGSQQERLIGERTRALALVLLTGREDLTAREVGAEDVGLDFLVSLHGEGKSGARQFGVVLRGSLAPLTPDQAKKVLRGPLGQLQRHGPFPFPVCLFLFTMREPQSWWAWAVEPVVDRDAHPRLVQKTEAACEPLDTRSLGQIVQQVHDWFDAFYSGFVSLGPGGNKKGTR